MTARGRGEEVVGDGPAEGACWWATIPRPVPRQAPTRDRPYGEEGGHKGSPLRRGGRHKGSPLRFVWQGTSVRWRAATRDRPYGEDGGHKGSPLRRGWRPQGIAPTARRAPQGIAPTARRAPQGIAPTARRAPQGIAPTARMAATRDRPYGEDGGHKGSPLRFCRGRPIFIALCGLSQAIVIPGPPRRHSRPRSGIQRGVDAGHAPTRALSAAS